MDTTITDLVNAVADTKLNREAIIFLQEAVITLNERIDAMVDITIPEPPLEDVFNIDNYFKDTWTNAIISAHDHIADVGGGVLYFPNGNYLIEVEKIKNMPSYSVWRGQSKEGVKIYTKATSVFNFSLMVVNKTDVTFENLTFDQSEDVAQAPSLSPYKACGFLWFNACNNIDIHDCIFLGTYGIVPVYADAWDSMTEVTQLVKFKNNKVYWQRKVDSWYDVSITHFQTKRLEYSGNYVECIPTDMITHVARTGLESHMPDGYITNNTFKGCQVGALNVPWASSWNTYDSEYVGSVLINKNTIVNAGAMGFELWLGLKGNGRDMKNVVIEENIIGLYLKNSNYSKPGEGICFYRGGSYTAEAYDIIIRRNQINFIYDISYVANLSGVRGVYSYLQWGENTGVFNLNVQNTLRRIEIYENIVRQFPYGFLNLYRRSGSSVLVHQDISFHNNESVDSHYASPLPHITKSDYCFTVGFCNRCIIKDNKIRNPSIVRIGEREELSGVMNLIYSGNEFV